MIKIKLNPEIFSIIDTRIFCEEIQIFPSLLLHPNLSMEYDLQVTCNNSYINTDLFTKYLRQIYTDEKYQEEIELIYNQIISQENFDIKINSLEAKYHLIYGVVSKFNKSDIKFFIEDWLDYKSIHIMQRTGHKKYENYMKWWRELTSVEYGLYWIASPSTRKMIEDLYKQNELCLINLQYKD